MSVKKTTRFRLSSRLLSGGVVAALIGLIPWISGKFEDDPESESGSGGTIEVVPPPPPPPNQEKIRKEAEIAALLAKDNVLEATNTAKSKAVEAQNCCDKAQEARRDAADAARLAENAAKSSDRESIKNAVQKAKQAAELAHDAAKSAREAAHVAKEQAALASSNANTAAAKAEIAFSYEASSASKKANKAKVEADLAMSTSHMNAQDAAKYSTQAKEAAEKAQLALNSIPITPTPDAEPPKNPDILTDTDNPQDLLRAAENLIADLVNATNSGSISGQADCYAPVVSAYFDKGRCTKSEIIQDLEKWRSTFSYYRINMHSWRAETLKNNLHGADCYVEIIANLSWRRRGRLTTKKFAMSYYIKSEPRPLIVAAETRAL